MTGWRRRPDIFDFLMRSLRGEGRRLSLGAAGVHPCLALARKLVELPAVEPVIPKRGRSDVPLLYVLFQSRALPGRALGRKGE